MGCFVENKDKNNELLVKYILNYVWATTVYYAVWLGSIIYLCTFFESVAPLWLLVLAIICKPYVKGDL